VGQLTIPPPFPHRLPLPHSGCPANTVTGNGAGSSLLRDPTQLHSLVSSLVSAVGHQVPVSVKMRSGFTDTGLFRDNLLALQEAGAAFVTVHPRTKQQAYSGRADWSLIALAKDLLSIPVVRLSVRLSPVLLHVQQHPWRGCGWCHSPCSSSFLPAHDRVSGFV
jgi:hypothetical protein